jgi:glucokinase
LKVDEMWKISAKSLIISFIYIIGFFIMGLLVNLHGLLNHRNSRDPPASKQVLSLKNLRVMRRLLGIDIGGTKCATSIGNSDGRILGRREIPTPRLAEDALGLLLKQALLLLSEHGAVESVGIVCGGPLDSVAGRVLSPPNLPGWDDIPVTSFFSDRLGLPAFLQNDANAGAMAEWLYGAGKGCRNMMFCTMGTGFGCGLVLEGKLYEGTNGNAGELGHVRLSRQGPVGYGKAGSVEGWCSGGGIAQEAKARVEAARAQGGRTDLFKCEKLTAQAVAAAAENGDPVALEIFADVGLRLGTALSLALDLLNLEKIVIGGIFARREGLIRPSMEAAMKEECLPGALEVCEVLPAALGESIGDVAALTVAQIGAEIRCPVN